MVITLLALVGVPVAAAKTKPTGAKAANTGGAGATGTGTTTTGTGTTPTTTPPICPTSTTTPGGTTTTPVGTIPAGTPTTGTTTPTPTTTPTGTTATPTSGGVGIAGPAPTACTLSDPTVPGYVAKIVNGLAYAPAQAPLAVQRAIWAGDEIRTKPYIYGGGHASFKAAGYDCSGTVSYVLHAAGALKTPEDSGDLMSWGVSGVGQWITVYTDPAHAFIEIAGIRLDTSAEDDPNPPPGSGPRWRPLYAHPQGFMARHPLGY
jgi:cell wall-associated NlpC family hydrolase